MNLKTPTTATPDPSRIYQLSDLPGWNFSGTALAVLGHPIKHSVSPQMHNAALQCMAQTHLIYKDWKYFKFEIHPNDLPEALSLMHQKQFRGINLTIPHKVQAVDLVVKMAEDAQSMGAVNTLFNEGDAGFSGYNSDGLGMETAVKRRLNTALKGATVILLGAGGAARAAAVQCLLSGCRELWIGNRNQERLQSLLAILKPIVEKQPERLMGFDLTALPQNLPRSALIINATSLGLKPEDAAPIDLQSFEPSCKVYDMIYSCKTKLIQAAEAQGMLAADGLSMLIWQGVRSLEIWSNTTVPAQSMMTAACHAMNMPHRDA